MKFTILGSKGFIGTYLTNFLQSEGVECFTPDIRTQDISEQQLGHVIYAIGLTSDFRDKPFETVEAHVCSLKKILDMGKFESFLYLSSTRIYQKSKYAFEDESLLVNPFKFEDIYNISKIMGESLCFAQNNPNVKIVRLSNVFGENFQADDFLFALIKEAVEKNTITLHTSEESEKDFIDVKDVVRILPKISLNGKHRIYNVASGVNTKTKDIVNKISEFTECIIEKPQDSIVHSFPIISIERIKTEFQFNPTSVLENIESLIVLYKSRYTNDKN